MEWIVVLKFGISFKSEDESVCIQVTSIELVLPENYVHEAIVKTDRSWAFGGK